MAGLEWFLNKIDSSLERTSEKGYNQSSDTHNVLVKNPVKIATADAWKKVERIYSDYEITGNLAPIQFDVPEGAKGLIVSLILKNGHPQKLSEETGVSLRVTGRHFHDSQIFVSVESERLNEHRNRVSFIWYPDVQTEGVLESPSSYSFKTIPIPLLNSIGVQLFVNGERPEGNYAVDLEMGWLV